MAPTYAGTSRRMRRHDFAGHAEAGRHASAISFRRGF